MEKLYGLAIFSILILLSFFYLKEKIFKYSIKLSTKDVKLENIFFFDKDLKLAILIIKEKKWYIAFNQNNIKVLMVEDLKKHANRS